MRLSRYSARRRRGCAKKFEVRRGDVWGGEGEGEAGGRGDHVGTVWRGAAHREGTRDHSGYGGAGQRAVGGADGR
eukprot:scaffold92604_cov79-Phaeocystis_antarctica.AAC.1